MASILPTVYKIFCVVPFAMLINITTAHSSVHPGEIESVDIKILPAEDSYSGAEEIVLEIVVAENIDDVPTLTFYCNEKYFSLKVNFSYHLVDIGDALLKSAPLFYGFNKDRAQKIDVAVSENYWAFIDVDTLLFSLLDRFQSAKSLVLAAETSRGFYTSFIVSFQTSLHMDMTIARRRIAEFTEACKRGRIRE